ncbi:peptidase domain-containing ABC transporter [Zobellia barbeyronii]|uniref:Peptidase domain-containing ABC transporter n=1 Tax=Zobellia barbeyronii TaxID=2748009 RepID=A0ABS5WJ97_9FLAO|nr:peptidase domain-containing ABC transporter [Zobellia barbeyronii]MBT2163471.1 peptidase domain-containing ABC transporter [Zobellia barbeyronii]
MSIKVKQHDIRDCGAACLASISSYYNLKIPIARIRQMAHTDKRGTNVLGLIKGAETLGFDAKGVRGALDALPNIPLPAIAHIIVNENLHHFVVIYKVTDKYVEVMDPGRGKMEKYTLDDWEKTWTGVLVLMQPNNNFEARDEKVSMLSRFWTLVNPHKSILFEALFGAVIYTLLGLSTSIYIEKITDYVLVDGNTNLLNLMSIIMILLLVFQIFIGSVQKIFVLRTGQKIDSQLILGYYKHLLKLPQRFFDTMKVGEITSRIGDAVKIRAFVNDASITLFVNIFIVIFSFALMYSYYWKLALIITMIIPLYLGIYFLMDHLNKKIERKLMENAADLESQLVESLNAVKTIKQFGVEDFANFKTETRFTKLLKSIYSSGLNSIFSGNSTEFLSRLFTIVLLWSGSYFVIEQEITPGELLSFYALIGYFTGPFTSIVDMNKTIQNAMIASDRLFEIMDLEREAVENKMDITAEDIGDIALRNIDFSYGTRVDVFEDFSMTFKKGKVSAIVGESGSGKTTLISLLQNLYPIKGGKITMGDYDIAQITPKSLRDLVAVVPQKVDLFSGNVIDNIALGDYEPDIKKVISISQKLGITEFIQTLPNGFETHLGENGAMLSGGQRQRIAIARALYKEPEVLVLDEATASLDTISEQMVQGTLRALKNQGKTLIIIAHRLSTVAFADEIFVLEKGKLIEQGSHNELLKNKDGKYADLWNKQTLVIE